MKEKILSFIIDENNKLLLLRGDSSDPQFHRSLWYVVTGSKEDIDNNLYDTVKREIKEETNLETEKIIDMNWTFEYESLDQICIEHAFISRVRNAAIKLNEESIDYRWLDFEDFINKIDWFYEKEELKNRLNKYLNM